MPEDFRRDPIIQIDNLSYCPLGAECDVLREISIEIHRGDLLLLLGPSGCGKSTLMRCLNGLIPHLDQGQMAGRVTVDGKDTLAHGVHDYSGLIGMVFQNPDDQILSLRVGSEVAFGLEMQGLSHDEIVARVDEFMELMEISHLKDRLTFAISGGQKQRVSIASNLAMLQQVLVLDDPTTDLDPIGKNEIVRALAYLHQEHGITLVIIEHDLNELIEYATRLVVMEEGGIVHDGPPPEILAAHYDDLDRLGVNIPQHVEIAHLLLGDNPPDGRLPMHKDEVLGLFQRYLHKHPGTLTEPPRRTAPVAAEQSAPVIQVRDLSFAYDPGTPVLKGINLEIQRGEFVAIVGANGSGKSTLVNNLIGLLQPDRGQIVIDGHDTRDTPVRDLVADIGYVFQNPDHQLFANSVEEELRFSLRVRHMPNDKAEERLTQTLRLVGLDNLRHRHPLSISRGQRQNLAVATALIHDPALMLLDEPTTGQDRRSLAGLLSMLARLASQGHTTIMVTHDMDIVAAYATRVIVMAEGQIVIDGHPSQVFYDHFDELAALNLRPPTIVDYCRRLQDMGCPRYLIVEELQNSLEGR
jgi:energy-coupling factor transport system ATP-binding protein